MARLLPLSLAASVVTFAGVSFAQTEAVSLSSMGVPETAELPGRAAVVFGWGQDDRRGWTIDFVRIDDRGRPEWDSDSQHPTVFYLRPGLRKLRLYSTRRPTRASEPPLRIRSRVVELNVAEGQVLICPVELGAHDPPIPAVSCRVASSREAGTSQAASASSQGGGARDEAGRDQPLSDQLARQLLERLTAVERRLERLEALITVALGRERSTPDEPRHESRDTRGELRIDTTPPW